MGDKLSSSDSNLLQMFCHSTLKMFDQNMWHITTQPYCISSDPWEESQETHIEVHLCVDGEFGSCAWSPHSVPVN